MSLKSCKDDLGKHVKLFMKLLYIYISVEEYKLLLKYFCIYDCKYKKYLKNVNYFRHLVAKTR